MKHLALVFVGGGLGSILRYLLSNFLNNSQTAFPYGTLLVNVVGSLLIGIIFGFALKNQNLSSESVLLLATGFCGGFTTFAAFAYENQMYLKSGDYMTFAVYSISTLVLSIAMVFVGMWLIKLV